LGVLSPRGTENNCDNNGSRKRKRGQRPLRREVPVIEASRQQLGFGDGSIAEEVADLQEDWRSAGSNKDRSGGPDVRVASASSSDGMVFGAASTGETPG
jgi:hypothetical protein